MIQYLIASNAIRIVLPVGYLLLLETQPPAVPNVEYSNSVPAQAPQTVGSLSSGDSSSGNLNNTNQDSWSSNRDTNRDIGRDKNSRNVDVCGARLLKLAGRVGPDTDKLARVFHKASRIKDKEFMQYVMAISFVESTFRKDVISPMNAHGLMQMTPIAVREAERFCKLPEIDSMDQMLDPYTNVKYGTCYLSYTLRQTDNNWDHSLIMYNGGKKQLDNYLSSRSMAAETVEYVKKVNRALTFCREEISNDI